MPAIGRHARRTRRTRSHRSTHRGEHLERRLALTLSNDSDFEVAARSLDLGHPQSMSCGCAGCALPPPDTLAFSQMQLPTEASFPLSETFQLHSRPGASKRIYLDFDGHTAVGTAWGNPIVTPAFSLDSNYDVFSDAERTLIQEVWSRVVEDFAPFDVDVTTEEPSVADLVNTGGGDTRWGVRVVVGGDGAWLPGAAGVAFLNGFGRTDLAPAFAFADQSWKANAAFASVVISHEVGHTLGLYHHGYQGSEYYGGRGNWGPLMGNPSRLLTQWSNGDYGGATRPQQDDLRIITTRAGNGFGYRPDDHGNSFATATPYAGEEISGLIEQNDDVDLIRFYTSSRVIADIRPASSGANLDVLAEILNASGQVIATSDPQGSLAANFNTTVDAGVYFLRVQGTGQGDPASTGYSKYGSLGQYTVNLTIDSNPAIDSVEDRVGSIQGLVPVGGRTNDPAPLVRGTAPPGTTVQLQAEGLVLGTGSTAADGMWSIAISQPLTDGSYRLIAGDSLGGISEDVYPITVDVTAPPVPVLTSVLDDQGSIQGPLLNGGRTDDTELRFDGTATAQTLVTVYGNGTPIGSVTAGEGGTWTFTTPALNSGPYVFTVTSTDDVGNQSNPTGSEWSLVVDTRLPAVPVITEVADRSLPNIGNVLDGTTTNDASPIVSGTGDPGSTVRVTSNGVLLGQSIVDATGVWQIVPVRPLPDSSYILVATARNEVGSESGTSAPYRFTVDTMPPMIAITRSGTGTLSIGSDSLITFTLSEPVTTFGVGDVITTGGTLAGFSGSGDTYTATFRPLAGFEGSASIVIAAGALADSAGSTNPGVSLNVPVDTLAPTIGITIGGPDVLIAGDSAPVTIILSERSTDFTADDFSVSGGTITRLTGSGTIYTATFVPAPSFRGPATIRVSANRFTDPAGNGNLGSSLLTIEVDTVAPTLTISRFGTGTLRIGESDSVVFTLSEPTTDFTAADVTVTGGSLAQFRGSGASYTATFIPAPNFQGTSTVGVATATFSDPSGNANLSASFGLPVDTRRPTVNIARSSSGPLKLGDTSIISFVTSEAVSGLTAADVSVSGGSVAGFSGSGMTYAAVFMPAPGFTGIATIAIAANAFSDLVGNANVIGDSLQMPVDTIPPRIAIERIGVGTLKIGDTARISLTTSEPTTDFTVDDLAVVGGTVTGFTGSGTFYTATFIPAPTFLGTATIAIPSARFTDATGNANVATSPSSLAVDTIAPRVIGFRTSATGAVLGIGDSISIVAELSEPVTPGTGEFAVLFDTGGRAALTVDSSGLRASGVYTTKPGELSGDLSVTSVVSDGTVRDRAGNSLATSLPAPAMNLAARHDIAVDAAVRFVDRDAFSTNPSIVPDAGSHYRRVRIRFTTPVVGVTLSRFIVTLDGIRVSLRGAVLRGRGADYELLLPASRLNPAGLYALSLRPEGGIRAASNGAAVDGQATLHWGYRRSLGMVPDVPSAVTPLRVTQSGQRSVVVLGWSVPAGNGGGSLTGYEVQYRDAGNGRWQTVRHSIPPSPSPTAQIGGLAPGRQYEFRVAARNAAGRGDYGVSPLSSVLPGFREATPVRSLTPLETRGAVTLAYDPDGHLYANGMPITLGGVSVARNPTSTAIWRFLAADVDKGVNTLVLQHSSGALRLWRMSPTWAQQSGEGYYAPGTSGHGAVEDRFNTDFDNDNVVGSGDAVIESRGGVVLSYDRNRVLKANGMAITFGGLAVKHDASPTAPWRFLAAETLNGVNTVLIQSSSGHLRMWRMNASWAQQYGEGWYAPGTLGYRSVEVTFGMDFDGNGSIGP